MQEAGKHSETRDHAHRKNSSARVMLVLPLFCICRLEVIVLKAQSMLVEILPSKSTILERNACIMASSGTPSPN